MGEKWSSWPVLPAVDVNGAEDKIPVIDNSAPDAQKNKMILVSDLIGLGLRSASIVPDADKPISTAQQAALDSKLPLAGGTMTGPLMLSGEPVFENMAVTKKYVDDRIPVVAKGGSTPPPGPRPKATSMGEKWSSWPLLSGTDVAPADDTIPILDKSATDADKNKMIRAADLPVSTATQAALDAIVVDMGEIVSFPEAPTDGATYARRGSDTSWQPVSMDWGSISGKPTTFPPSTHSHPIGEVTGLQAQLDLKAPLASPVFTGSPTTAADPTVALGLATKQYVDGKVGGATGGAVIADTPPAGPASGQFWWESDTGKLWLYYNDGTSSQWVLAAGSGSVPSDPLKADKTYVDAQDALKLNLTGGTLTGALTCNVPLGVASGGTGASTAAGARTALGLAPIASSGSASDLTTGTVPGARRDVTINAQTGTSYTFVLADDGLLCTFSNAAAQTVTVPPNSSVAFPVGAKIDVAALGAGKVTLAQGAGVTINSAAGYKALGAQYAGGTLIKLATDTWLLIGNLQA